MCSAKNVHTHPMEGHWKFQEHGVGGLKAKFFKGRYEAKLESPAGWWFN